MIAVTAQFTMEQIQGSLTVTMMDIPAVTRAARAEVAAIDAYEHKLQQQALEDAKKQKPTL
jgi:ABC-type phosphate transport system permease subunit